MAGISTRVPSEQPNDGYYLAIRDDGQYSLGKRVQGETIPTFDWRPHPAINLYAETNTLELVANGAQISGVINGRRVGTFTDKSFTNGSVGLFSENSAKTSQGTGFKQATVRVQEVQAMTESPREAIEQYYYWLNQQDDRDS